MTSALPTLEKGVLDYYQEPSVCNTTE